MTYALKLRFDTDTDDFVRGFEAGRIWTQLKNTDDPVDATIHATNTEMIMRIAEATSRTATGTSIDDTWTAVRFTEPDA